MTSAIPDPASDLGAPTACPEAAQAEMATDGATLGDANRQNGGGRQPARSRVSSGRGEGGRGDWLIGGESEMRADRWSCAG
ncbi:hypothetical protein E2562_030515 [Oryza meyeriana var. granulata]|uniref:Uncharacterized protein n=1 Tax=Oryza meyeriana var. granulata TaxID=110450 RepID=A0A6G1BQP1_9ORYZ|nr:hypothetical protein E2562_030515 [Oryza meyeriana var. granulata]